MTSWKRFVAKGVCTVWKFAHRVIGSSTGFRVLMYHAVGTIVPDDRLGLYNLAPDLFRSQMELVAATGEVTRFSTIGERNHGISVTFDDGYQDTLEKAAPILADLGIPFTVFVTTDYIRKGDKIYLSSDGLCELANVPGADIGAHSASHRPLTECEDEALHNELVSSRAFLEDLLGQQVDAMSYPHGAVDRRVQQAVAAAGYVLGACSRFGTNKSKFDPLLLARTDIWANDDLKTFQAKLAGDWDWLGWKK